MQKHLLAVLSVAVVVVTGCRAPNTTDPIADLRAAWDRPTTATDGKSSYMEHVASLWTILAQRWAVNRAAILDYLRIQSRQSIPRNEHEERFAGELQRAVCRYAIMLGDSDAVVGLLSDWCQEYIGVRGIEFVLATEYPPGAFEGLSLLFVAHPKASPANQECLAHAIRRAVWPYVPSDAPMADCLQWLKSNADRNRVDANYLEVLLQDGDSGTDEPPTRLFLER
jgi:hypothetical protein